MLVINATRGVELVESALLDLANNIGEQDVLKLRENSISAMRQLGEARRLFREPSLSARIYVVGLEAEAARKSGGATNG